VKVKYCTDVKWNTLALYLLGRCVYYDVSVFFFLKSSPMQTGSMAGHDR